MKWNKKKQKNRNKENVGRGGWRREKKNIRRKIWKEEEDKRDTRKTKLPGGQLHVPCACISPSTEHEPSEAGSKIQIKLLHQSFSLVSVLWNGQMISKFMSCHSLTSEDDEEQTYIYYSPYFLSPGNYASSLSGQFVSGERLSGPAYLGAGERGSDAHLRGLMAAARDVSKLTPRLF